MGTNRHSEEEDDGGILFDEEGIQEEEDSAEAVKKRDASKAEKEVKRALARSAKTAVSRQDDDEVDIDNI